MADLNLILKSFEIENMKGDERIHFLNQNANRIRKSIGDVVGLTKIGVHTYLLHRAGAGTDRIS